MPETEKSEKKKLSRGIPLILSSGFILVLCLLLFRGYIPNQTTSLQSPPSSPSRHENSPRTKIKIFVTHDVHGHAVLDTAKGRIGYALLRGYVDAMEREGYRTFLLDAGDAFSGSAYAQLDSGRSIAEIMGKMGYDVLAPGNHAFDFNACENSPLYYSDTLIRTVNLNAKRKVAVTCLNMTYRGRPVPGVTPGPIVIHDGGGDFGPRIVLLGVLTPYVAKLSNLAGVRDYDFGLVTTASGPDHQTTKEKLLAEIAEAIHPFDKPNDIVLILSHVGFDGTYDYSDGQITGRDIAGVANVDMVADSHSHNLYPVEKIGGTYYGIAGRYLEHFFEITVSADNNSLTTRFEIKSLTDVAGFTPSPAITELLEGITTKLGFDDRLAVIHAPSSMIDDNLNLGNLPLGRFICRSLMNMTGADLALYNSGGIRSGLASGRITSGEIYDLLPFQNNLMTYAATGREILEMFNSLPERGTNGFPQFYGMTVFAWEKEGDPGVLAIAGILDGEGKQLDTDAVYTVAINSFMAEGGDGFSFAPEKSIRDYGDTASLFIEYLRDQKDLYVDELWPNNTLLLFETREEAEKAYSKVH